jgi:hypothetical protein
LLRALVEGKNLRITFWKMRRPWNSRWSIRWSRLTAIWKWSWIRSWKVKRCRWWEINRIELRAKVWKQRETPLASEVISVQEAKGILRRPSFPLQELRLAQLQINGQLYQPSWRNHQRRKSLLLLIGSNNVLTMQEDSIPAGSRPQVERLVPTRQPGFARVGHQPDQRLEAAPHPREE